MTFIIFTGCAGLYTEDKYRIKTIENNFSYSLKSSRNLVYLTNPVGEDKWSKGRVVLEIRMYDKVINYDYNVLSVSTYKEESIINGKKIIPEKNKYKKPEILNDVIITKKNSEKIILNKDKIKYTYKENPNTNFKEALIYLPEILSGPIILEFGKVKIGGEIYNVPKIYMQKYRVTESYSLLGSMLEEGGEHLPGYHSEKWIDD